MSLERRLSRLALLMWAPFVSWLWSPNRVKRAVGGVWTTWLCRWLNRIDGRPD